MRSFALVLFLLSAGCLKPDVVDCADGRTCPGGTKCDIENATCVDPLGLAAPSGRFDLGTIECGTSKVRTLPLSNLGITPIEVEARSTVADVAVSPAVAVVEPSSTVDIEIMAAATRGSRPGMPIEGAIVLRTNYQLFERGISFQTSGGVAVVSDVDLGDVFLGTPATKTVTIRNEGNHPFRVIPRLSSSAGFSLASSGTAVTIAPSSEAQLTVAFQSTNASATPITAAIDLEYMDAMCQTPASQITVKARPTNDVVTVTKTEISFAPSVCGAAPAPQTFSLVNHDTAADQVATLSLSGPDAAEFSVTPTTLDVGHGTTSQPITLTRRTVPTESPLGTTTATLKIQMSGGLEKYLNIGSEIAGPVLSTSLTMLEFGGVRRKCSASQSINVKNEGPFAEVTITPSEVPSTTGVFRAGSSTLFLGGANPDVDLTTTFLGGDLVGAFPTTLVSVSAAGQCSPTRTIAVRGSTVGGSLLCFEEQQLNESLEDPLK